MTHIKISKSRNLNLILQKNLMLKKYNISNKRILLHLYSLTSALRTYINIFRKEINTPT
jgi:hypothetical protein